MKVNSDNGKQVQNVLSSRNYWNYNNNVFIIQQFVPINKVENYKIHGRKSVLLYKPKMLTSSEREQVKISAIMNNIIVVSDLINGELITKIV